MAFNNFPYTNFQDLNLGWILQTYKEALTKATEALAKAVSAENTAAGYSEQINTANANASEALSIARNANEVLFIFADPENKAVNYVNYSQGETVYIAAQDIFSAITADHKVPIFMDNMLYVYELAGYETDPEQPLMVTRFKFTKKSENSTDIAWIDRNGSITYTRIQGGGNGFPVVFNYIPQNPELAESGYWDSDKTYAEILAAINNGESIFLTVKIDGETRELINNAYISKSANGTYIALGYSRGFDIYDSPYYTNTDNLLVYYTINANDFVSVHKMFTVPPSSTQLTSRVLTVNSSGKAEWLPASGGGISIQDVIDTVNDGDTNALLSTAQTLSAAEKAQVKQNLGISDSGGSYSPYLIPVTQIGNSYSTTATGYDVFDHILDCRIVFNGVYYYQIGSTLSGAFGDAYFACTNPSAIGTIENDIFAVRLNGNSACTITKYDRDVSLLPVMSSADAGKFARVNSSGVWVAETVPSAESNSFGGA